MRYGEDMQPVIAGTMARIAMSKNMRPMGPPRSPQAYDGSHINAIPIRMLSKQIEARAPLTNKQVQDLRNRIVRKPSVVW